MKFNKLLKFAAVSLASVTILAACGGNEEDKAVETSGTTDTQSGEVKKVKVAYAIGWKPISYQDENGEAAGYDLDALRLVDEALEDYEFEYIGTTDDDLLIGVEQGKYDIGVKNVFYTEERAQKYVYPKEFLGLSSTGLLLKKEKADIKNLVDFATAGLELAPIAANNAQYTVIAEHNEANPDNPVKLVAGDEFAVDAVQWVNEGRADGAVALEPVFNLQVIDEKGPYHNLIDEVVYNEFTVIKTWPLFNKEQQDLANAYDEVMTEIKKSDELNQLMIKHYGKDLFEVLETVTR
ncbi:MULTISPECIES: transporter substrate-binding domain-containing protein [Lysinibacillus]|uniref:Transporter substrate-binding domain-containing protein n=1 Tax=Lysinibacillus antri TaxID=2498145 RepID=A0A432LCS5_9BACI|nr:MULTISPECIES: transporter substrate-binding domain-containing protein [Lysinibacillus]RUL53136.1 transporter substrate-binding domain-containing protein [Lysinibacillus antri]TSI07464.1 transporter substrate-binding domain-containing protein [Lysinibacillus sp. BW-2-10]